MDRNNKKSVVQNTDTVNKKLKRTARNGNLSVLDGGYIIRLTGSKKTVYNDSEEFAEA